jgi:hypothetical protein
LFFSQPVSLPLAKVEGPTEGLGSAAKVNSRWESTSVHVGLAPICGRHGGTFFFEPLLTG